MRSILARIEGSVISILFVFVFCECDADSDKLIEGYAGNVLEYEIDDIIVLFKKFDVFA